MVSAKLSAPSSVSNHDCYAGCPSLRICSDRHRLTDAPNATARATHKLARARHAHRHLVVRGDEFQSLEAARSCVNALSLLDDANISLGTGTGTKIGTATNQKLGLFGVAPVTQPSGADQQAVTLENVENAIGGLTFSDPPTQAELQALSSACETLASDVRALSNLVHALRTAGVILGVWTGE